MLGTFKGLMVRKKTALNDRSYKHAQHTFNNVIIRKNGFLRICIFKEGECLKTNKTQILGDCL